jgi:hypothetical protein
MLLTFASGSRISKDVSTSDAGGADALEREPPRRGLDMVLLAAALGTLLTLALAMTLGEPANVVSLGLHQEYGACAVPDIDLSGYARTKYLCQAELDEDFHFGCVRQRLPPAQPKWYTICGKGIVTVGSSDSKGSPGAVVPTVRSCQGNSGGVQQSG